MKKNYGFTITELLIVLALIAILAVMSLGIADSITFNSRITSVINNFLADFSQAKLLASAENRYVSINFDADGRTYTIAKQTDVSDYTAWTLVKTVRPMKNENKFYDLAKVSDFAVNSTGEVRTLPIDLSQNPNSVSLVFYILDNKGNVAYKRTIQIFPYGGLKVEKY